MAHVTGFDFDVFLSYSHVDNLRTSSRRKGWVEIFHHDLEVRLAQCSGRIGNVSVWWDERRVKGNDVFDVAIQKALQRSATFVALTSHSYLASDYCAKELVGFHHIASRDSHGLTIGDRSRIVNVLLYDIPHERWPDEYQKTGGVRFYATKQSSKHGKPCDPEKGDFENRMYQLAEEIYSLLVDFDANVTRSAAAIEMEHAPEPAFSAEAVTVEPSPPLSAVEKTVLVDFHSKDYDQALLVHEFLQQHGFTTLTGPDANNPRDNMQMFQDRLQQAGTMVIPVHKVSEEWVRERVKAALQVIAVNDCPTKAILVHVVAPRLAPPSTSTQFGRVTVRWLDKNTAAADGGHALSQLLDAIEVALT